MNRFWPDRLASRIIVSVLLVVILAQFALSWLFFASYIEENWTKDQYRYATQQSARVRTLIETVRDRTDAQTSAIMKIANGQDFHAWISQDTQAISTSEDFRATDSPKSLTEALKPISGVGDIHVSSFVPVHLGDYEAILSAPDRIVYGYGVDVENVFIEVQVRSDTWLRILAPSTEFQTDAPPWRENPNLLLIVLIAVSIVPALILIVRQVVKPIHNLARFAERIGRGGWRFDDIPETGPLETRQAARAMNIMAARIRDFVEDRTRMLAAISHDIASPLTGMRLQAEMVEDAEIRNPLIRGIEEISSMSQSTLSFARLDAANEEPEQVELAEFIENLVHDYNSDQITFIAAENARNTLADIRKVQMRRVFRNVIDNALKYGKTAALQLDTVGGEFQLEVRDTGPGLSVELREQVFEPFFRGDPSRSPETGGTGLGLSIARNLVRLHGGDISLSNHDDGGLVVQISIPLSNSVPTSVFQT